MKDQSKTPGAMVLVETFRDCLHRGKQPTFSAGDLKYFIEELLRLSAPAEQTPAVGGSIAERIRAATIADSGQEGVNIAEGRFGRAMAALCLQLDGEAPAVGGEPEVFLMVRNLELNSTWRLADKAAFDCAGTLPKYDRMELIDRAHVAPLLAENKRLDLMVSQADYNYDADRAKWANEKSELVARIAELEAQQGEPVAWQLDVEGYQVVTVDNYQRALSEQEHFHGRGRSAIVHGLYREAQPATAKVVLPERMTIQAEASGFKNGELKGWNACLDEIARLNP